MESATGPDDVPDPLQAGGSLVARQVRVCGGTIAAEVAQVSLVGSDRRRSGTRPPRLTLAHPDVVCVQVTERDVGDLFRRHADGAQAGEQRTCLAARRDPHSAVKEDPALGGNDEESAKFVTYVLAVKIHDLREIRPGLPGHVRGSGGRAAAAVARPESGARGGAADPDLRCSYERCAHVDADLGLFR